MPYRVIANSSQIADGTIDRMALVAEALKNAPNAFAILNEDGQIVGPIIVRAGTAAELDALTLDMGEIAYATDTGRWRMGDGATAGGLVLQPHEQNTDTGTANESFQVNSGSNTQAEGPPGGNLQSGMTNVQSGLFCAQSGGDNTQKDVALYSAQSGRYNVQAGTSGLQFGERADDEYRAVDKAGWSLAFTHGGGRFAVDGDAQNMRFVLREEVTHNDAAWYLLRINSVYNGRLYMPVDSVWTFRALVVGTTQGCAKAFSYIVEGCIENDGGVTTVHAATVTTVHEDDADFDCQVVTDANDDFQIQVQDSTSGGDTVRWVATVDVAQVRYGAA